jgi:hypothetical protein
MAEKNPNDPIGAVERIYKAWDEALGAKDLDAAVALYAPEATIESPLVAQSVRHTKRRLPRTGRVASIIRLVFQRQPAARKRFRTRYFTDGTKLMWEYPRDTPDGEQMDFVEVMELKEGLIQHHRVYWGWFGLSILKKGQHYSLRTARGSIRRA